MWYKDSGVISIAGQGGGPRNHGINIIKIDFSRLLKEHCTSTHCPAVDHYALALRVGGEFVDWSPERIHKVRRSRQERYIGCDIDIPVAVWHSQTTNQLKDYLAAKVREAMEILVARLQKDKEPVDTTKLYSEIDESIKLFRANHYEDIE